MTTILPAYPGTRTFILILPMPANPRSYNFIRRHTCAQPHNDDHTEWIISLEANEFRNLLKRARQMNAPLKWKRAEPAADQPAQQDPVMIPGPGAPQYVMPGIDPKDEQQLSLL